MDIIYAAVHGTVGSVEGRRGGMEAEEEGFGKIPNLSVTTRGRDTRNRSAQFYVRINNTLF